MANEDPQVQREQVTHRYWDLKIRIGDAMAYGPIGALLVLLLLSGRGAERWLAVLPIAWTAFYVVVAPGVVWLAYFADGMAVRRTITALVAGAAPGVFLLPGSPLTDKPLIWGTLPALIAWGSAGYYFSFHRLPAARSRRTPIMILGALACFSGAIGSLVVLAAYWPAPRDPAFAQQLAIAISGVCVAAALLFGWQGVRLLQRLHRT